MIRFMVDSAADCGKEENLCDALVPILIRLGEEDYLDGVDLGKNQFYELLTTTKAFPQTSQPTPHTFLAEFQKVKEAGDELICFCISSGLSGTYQGACLAKEMADYDKIFVIDTLAATHMIGVLVTHAAKLRAQGCSVEQIVDSVEELKTRVHVLAGLDTLEYLRRGGRLSNASAVAGSLAQIKPILTVTPEGRVEAQGKSIGKARAMQEIVRRIQQVELDPDYALIPLFSFGEDNCAMLEERLTQEGFRLEHRRQIGPTIGAHTGPGVYGVIFITK